MRSTTGVIAQYGGRNTENKQFLTASLWFKDFQTLDF